MRVELHPEARAEVRAAALWYEERSLGLGDQFFEQVNEVLQRLEVTPALHPIWPGTEAALTLWTTTDGWRTDEVSSHMSDAVVVDNILFGLSHLNSGQYFALDLDSGKVLWKSDPRQATHAAIARAGNTIFSLEDDSELVVIRLNRQKFEPVVRYKVAGSDT